MSGYKKLMQKILSGRSDANIKFEELRNLLLHLGFEERIRASHHIFRKSGVKTMINIQASGKMAKPYQIKQVRNVIVENKLSEGYDD